MTDVGERGVDDLLDPVVGALCEVFPRWYRAVADDAVALAGFLLRDEVPELGRRRIACSIVHLVRLIEMIPLGLEELGYLEAAFVLRVTAGFALKVPGMVDADLDGVVRRMAGECEHVEMLFGKDYGRFESYVRSLDGKVVRGVGVYELVKDAAVSTGFVGDLAGWARRGDVADMVFGEVELIRLRGYLLGRCGVR
ncbi:MAG: hypothetical protein FWD57_15625 [Polyangiaceae bacterium]|nr:hypothetical protein [Polyangiaceae bacterium]